jgi:hypothetical protein
VAGSDRPPRELLVGWLRRAAQVGGGETRVLRGSLLVGAWCGARARPAADVDYLLVGDGVDAEAFVQAAIAHADPAGAARTTIVLDRFEDTWVETAFPGRRAHVRGQVGEGDWHHFHVDLSSGDPLSLPPRPVHVDGAGDVLAAAPETMFAWKLHGLCEFGAGRWRAKDLYDLDLLAATLPLAHEPLREAVALAFSSRSASIDALADFRTRDSWGTSRGGVRKWRALAATLPPGVTLEDFLAVRARVRAAVDALDL